MPLNDVLERIEHLEKIEAHATAAASHGEAEGPGVQELCAHQIFGDVVDVADLNGTHPAPAAHQQGYLEAEWVATRETATQRDQTGRGHGR